MQEKHKNKSILKKGIGGITLIALVVTIIVLLILAGISISMLSGNNGILTRAGQAKERTERQSVIEQARLDIFGQQANNKETNITKVQLAEILNNYFNTIDATLIPDEISSKNDMELITLDGKYKINLSEIFNAKFSAENNDITFGEMYDDSMIGKTIDYKAEKNNINDWIIIGKQTNEQGKNDIIITTKIPPFKKGDGNKLIYWVKHESLLRDYCINCIGTTGTLGTKAAIIKEERSITLNDINNAIGFTLPETFDEFTFGTTQNYGNKQVNYYYPDETNITWINPSTNGTTWKHLNDVYYFYNDNGTYKYSSIKNNFSDVALTTEHLCKANNFKYILAGGKDYWVATRSVGIKENYATFNAAAVYSNKVFSGLCVEDDTIDSICLSSANAGVDGYNAYHLGLRPVVVLSSEILWDDVKGLIGDYAEY